MHKAEGVGAGIVRLLAVLSGYHHSPSGILEEVDVVWVLYFLLLGPRRSNNSTVSNPALGQSPAAAIFRGRSNRSRCILRWPSVPE